MVIERKRYRWKSAHRGVNYDLENNDYKAPAKLSQHFEATYHKIVGRVSRVTWPPSSGSNLKMVKFFIQHLWMLHDVVVIWPGSCNCACVLLSSIFNTQNVATRRNRVAKPTQHLRPTMLRSFCRSLQMLGQKPYMICCVYMLRSFGRGSI